MREKIRHIYKIAVVGLLFCFINAPIAEASQNADNSKGKLPQHVKEAADTNRINSLLAQASRLIEKDIISQAECDKALGYCQQAIALSVSNKFEIGQARGEQLIANNLIRQQQEEKAIKYAQHAIKVFQKHNLLSFQADSYLVLAKCSLGQSAGPAQSETFCNRAINIYQQTAPNSNKLADAYSFLGRIHRKAGKELLSFKDFNEALRLYNNNHSTRVGRIYGHLAVFYSHANNNNLAIENSYKSLKLSEQNKDTATIFSNCTILASLNEKANRPLQSIRYLKRARELVNYKTDNNSSLFLAGRLALLYSTAGQYANAFHLLNEGLKFGLKTDELYWALYLYKVQVYVKMKKYQEAEANFTAIFKLLKDQPANWHYLRQESQLTAVRLYLEKRQFKEAQEYFNQLIELKPNTPSPSQLIEREMLNFKLDSAQGHLQPAINHYQNYKRLSDSISNSSHSEQIAQIEILYDLDKKNQDINLKQKNIDLLTNQTRLQLKALHSEATVKNLFVTAVGLLTLLLGISYNRYKLKQTAHKKLSEANYDLEEQKEEINVQNEYLKQLVTEREWLIKEVHHRVKNNLQIVISLLNSQLADIKDVAAKNVIMESRHRMHCISLIHQKLYQNENLSVISMDEYIRELIENLKNSAGRTDISFLIDVNNFTLDVSQAVPIGLILNEAITNAIKYAFPEKRPNAIIKIMMQDYQETLVVSIADNGVGLPANLNLSTAKSLGIKLIKGLTNQLKGKFTFTTDAGFKVMISVPIIRALKLD